MNAINNPVVNIAPLVAVRGISSKIAASNSKAPAPNTHKVFGSGGGTKGFSIFSTELLSNRIADPPAINIDKVNRDITLYWSIPNFRDTADKMESKRGTMNALAGSTAATSSFPASSTDGEDEAKFERYQVLVIGRGDVSLI